MRTEASKLNQNMYLEVSNSDPISDIITFVNKSYSSQNLDIFTSNKFHASVQCTVVSEDADQTLYEIKILRGRLLGCQKNKSIYIYSGKDKKHTVLSCRKEALSKLINNSISYMKEEIRSLAEK
jgi:hypothetical protein